MQYSITTTNLKTFDVHCVTVPSSGLPVFVEQRLGRMYKGLMAFTRGGVHYFVSQHNGVDDLVSRL